jgi:hypothetical protein
MYFGKHFAWLKYFTYLLSPLLAVNYKRMFCQMCLFEFIRVEGD